MNFEIKLKVSDIDLLKEKIQQLNAEFIHTQLQDDTYFDVENGYLKIRRSNNEPIQLIQYFKNPSSMGMQSNYAMVSVKKTDRISTMLTRAHGIRSQVQKIRDVWQYHSFHIYLDKIEGIGYYLKLVAQDRDDAIQEEIHKNMQRLIRKLKLEEAKIIQKSYCELIETSKK